MRAATDQDIIDTLALFQWSEMHRTYTIDEFDRLVLPALEMGTYHIWRQHFDGRDAPIAFCSWYWLDKHAADWFSAGEQLTWHDIDAGGDQLWFMDWINMGFISNATMIRQAMRWFEPGTRVQWMRTHRNNKRGFITTRQTHGGRQ